MQGKGLSPENSFESTTVSKGGGDPNPKASLGGEKSPIWQSFALPGTTTLEAVVYAANTESCKSSNARWNFSLSFVGRTPTAPHTCAVSAAPPHSSIHPFK